VLVQLVDEKKKKRRIAGDDHEQGNLKEFVTRNWVVLILATEKDSGETSTYRNEGTVRKGIYTTRPQPSVRYQTPRYTARFDGPLITPYYGASSALCTANGRPGAVSPASRAPGNLGAALTGPTAWIAQSPQKTKKTAHPPLRRIRRLSRSVPAGGGRIRSHAQVAV
jgi:hypothetical protein